MPRPLFLWVWLTLFLAPPPPPPAPAAEPVAADPSPRAEARRLLELAQQNRLDDSAAERAAELLPATDPFVRGMAEWALALRVGHENNGQRAVWPAPDPPDWFTRWHNLPADTLVEQDWVRQAVAAGLDRDPARLLASLAAMSARARVMRSGFADRGASSDALAALEGALADLQTLSARLAGQIQEHPDDLAAQAATWLDARRVLRRIALVNPAIRFQQLLLVTRYAPHTPRNITRTFAWQHKPGGGISMLGGLDPTAPLELLLDRQLGPGHVHSLDLSWDAERLVFSYARQPQWPPGQDTTTAAGEGRAAHELRRVHPPLQLWEIARDGRGLRQLTNDPYWNDFEPAWCPDGSVVFASDRCGRAAECGPFDYDIANANLYRVAADGGPPWRVTDSKDLDRHPCCLNDGRLAYTHWEYQERHFMEVHSLWAARPDGMMSDALFKQHLPAPLALRSARPVPDSRRLVAVATGHHTFAWGPVVLIDPARGVNAADAIRVVTPGVKPQEGPSAGTPQQQGGVLDAGGLYQTPWALSDECFLVSYSYARPNCSALGGVDSNGFAVYLIDVYGNRELVFRDRLLSSCYPVPITRRVRPPQLPDLALSASPSKGSATRIAEPARVEGTPEVPPGDGAGGTGGAVCYVADVYEGLSGIARGSVHYLRVAQHVGWPLDPSRGMAPYFAGAAYDRQFGYWSWSPVRVLGTVPVHEDGSASFRVPADTAVYFQLLDERFMELRRMRSFVSLQHGETRGCRGCHETQSRTPAAHWGPALAVGQPQDPAPPPWGAQRLLGYEWLIQPILDRHCVSCHGEVAPDGELDFSSRRGPDGLFQSFRTMFGRGLDEQSLGPPLVSTANRFSDSSVTQPKQFGSHRSPLIRTLLEDPLHCREVQLDDLEWYSLVTWIDCNAPYYDRFIDKRPGVDHGPLTTDHGPRTTDH